MTTAEDPPAAEAADGTAETTPEAATAEVTTKDSIREETWMKLKSEEVLVGSSIAVYRTPNFIGAEEAARRLSETEEFSRAKTVCVSGDRAQEKIQYLVVQAKKKLLIQIRLLICKGLLKAVEVPNDISDEQKQEIISRATLRPYSKTVRLSDELKIDILVMGSTAVSRDGYRIGRGGGFADLEHALFVKMGLLTPETIVVTTVHDHQVFDELPRALFLEHDVGVDLIVTPTQVIRVPSKALPRPGIIWRLLSSRHLKALPVLRQLHGKDKSAGEQCELKEDDSNSRRPQHRPRPRPRPRQSKFAGGEDGPTSGGEEPGAGRPRRRRGGAGDEGGSRPRRNQRVRLRPPVDFSLRVSNIASDVRVRDLKNALAECKVKPVDIKWRGQNGYALLHFARMAGQAGDGSASVDSILVALRDLKVAGAEGEAVSVEPVNVVTRIEVTNEITAV